MQPMQKFVKLILLIRVKYIVVLQKYLVCFYVYNYYYNMKLKNQNLKE